MGKNQLKNRAKDIKRFLKTKKLFFAPWSCENKFCPTFNNWDKDLRSIFDKVYVFDPQMYYYKEGKEKTNKRLKELLEKEKPDYIFLYLVNNVLDMDFLFEIKKMLPNAKIIAWNDDDDVEFENRARYTSLISDYRLIVQKDYLKEYEKEGLKNVFFISETGTHFDKPLKLEKKYDVTFVGVPKYDRYQLIKFLKENQINVNIFGIGWEKYPEFKSLYHGPLTNEELRDVMTKTRINLCLIKNDFGQPAMKCRIFEMGAYGSFLLTESYKELAQIFKQNKEIVMFKDKEELLEKIKYYLNHEKERERIAESMYKKISREYKLERGLKPLFNQIFMDKDKTFSMPKINKKIALLREEDFEEGIEKIKEKVNESDYVCFKKGKVNFYKSKNYLQAYSLEKLRKPVSCCDYHVYSKRLGDYLEFSSLNINKKTKKEINPDVLSINQLMVTKDFLFKNVDKFKAVFENRGKIDFLSYENTAFISIPLLRIEDFKSYNYNTIKNYFYPNFLDNFRPLVYKNELLTNQYIYNLLFESIFKNKIFLLKGLFENLSNKDKTAAIKRLRNKEL